MTMLLEVRVAGGVRTIFMDRPIQCHVQQPISHTVPGDRYGRPGLDLAKCHS